MAGEVWISGDDERSGLLLHERRECRFKIPLSANAQDDELQPERVCSFLHLAQLWLCIQIGRIDEHADDGSVRNEIVKQLQPFCRQYVGKKADASEIATGPIEASHEALHDRVAAALENHRDR